MENKKVKKCDICSSKVIQPNGYCYTTRDILTTPGYWERAIAMMENRNSQMPETANDIYYLVVLQARNKTGWLVCDDCASHLNIATKAAQELVQKWWTTGEIIMTEPICTVDQGSVIYNDRQTFDITYQAARTAFGKYYNQKLAEYISNHKPEGKHNRKAQNLLRLLFESGVDVRTIKK